MHQTEKDFIRTTVRLLVFATLTVALAAQPLHAASCIISGETNRVSAASTNRTFTGTLDSYWRSVGSACFETRFRLRPTGLSVILH